MSQKEFLSRMDRSIHQSMRNAGIADVGVYSTPATGALECSVYLDRQVEVLGDFEQVVEARDELRFLRVTVAPMQGGRVTIRGEDGQDESWRLAKCLSDDGSMSRWVVQRG